MYQWHFDHSQLALILHLCRSQSQSNGTVSQRPREEQDQEEGEFASQGSRGVYYTPTRRFRVPHLQANADQPTYMHYWTLRPMQTHSHTKWSTKERILFAHGTHPCKSTISTAKLTVCVFLSTSSQTLTHTHRHTLYRHKEKWHDTFLFTTTCRLSNLPPFPPLYQLSSIWLLPSDSTAESAFHLTVQKKVRLLQTEISGWRDALSLALILRWWEAEKKTKARGRWSYICLNRKGIAAH